MRFGRTLLGATCVAVLVAACTPTPPGPPPEPAPGPLPPREERPWPMHTIAGAWRGANALAAGDVNGDGLADLLTIYEFDQRYVVSLHPPAGSDPRRAWRQVEVFRPEPLVAGSGVNPESAAFGDVDGDGHLDVIGAQGESQTFAFWEGNEPGVRIVWGPGPERAADEGAWVDAGRIPASIDRGHHHFVTAPTDLNGDGITDIVAGGRQHGGTGEFAGIQWYEAPADPAQRRNLAAWQLHYIDRGTQSGHGVEFVDLDGDGDLDLVNANADFDTPPDARAVHWYENPGPDSPTLRSPWTRRTLMADPRFHTKPGVRGVDLDHDGRRDIVTQLNDRLVLFRNLGGTPGDPTPRFERHDVAKDGATTWLSRTITAGDFDGDGRMDLVGGLVHSDSVLPITKRSVYRATWRGADPWTGTWTFSTVRWGSGDTALIPEFGEKWDRSVVMDVDGDGDLDVVMNNEELWQEDDQEFRFYFLDDVNPETMALVWFENTLADPDEPAREVGGTVTIEAEDPSLYLDGYWQHRDHLPGALGTGYLQAFSAIPPVLDDTTTFGEKAAGRFDPRPGTGVRYDVHVDGGEYSIWARRRVPSRWGWGMGGHASDSAWILLDGGSPEVLDDGAGPDAPRTDTWQWVRVPGSHSLAAGHHTVTVRIRERGYMIDRLLLTRNPGFVPAS